jgi:hypothetical protein
VRKRDEDERLLPLTPNPLPRGERMKVRGFSPEGRGGYFLVAINERK